jgi:hypothetical protein
MANTPVTESVSDVIDRRNESRKYMQQNYWDEWESVYRYSKCLAPKLMRKNKQTGQDEEDTSRTNVCMPETSLSIRRSVARLTANHPQINYTSPDGNEETEQKLTAWAYQQFDRSGEAQQHRKMVHTGDTFGWSVSKLWWDTIEQKRTFQRSFVGRDGQNVSYRDRAGLMRMQGAPDDEIEQATQEQGQDLSDNEVSAAIAKHGNTINVPQMLKKYEGPISKNVFLGDIFIEPGCEFLDVSGWCTENYWEGMQFLEKMQAKQYEDPNTGEMKPVFDAKACSELADMGTWAPNQGSQQPYDLRTRFRTIVLNQQVPLFPTKLLPGKRFDILEQHAKDDDGRMWIQWVGNERVFLGKMPYPWELYGKYLYTEFVPLFDIISAIGDSIPRLHRFLQSLHNSGVGQRKDIIRNLLKPLLLQRTGEDVADEQSEFAFFRSIVVKDPKNFTLFAPEIYAALASAFNGSMEEEAQVMRMWALSDPSISNTESGTSDQPQAGKTATTAVLAAKSADALTQFKLDSLNWYLKEHSTKKLHMLQQNLREPNEPYKVDPKYANKVEALSQRSNGKTSLVCLYPDEIQEDFGVEPEAMSMLSADDDIRRNAAMAMMQAASSMPGVFDPYYVGRFYAGTIRGVDPDKAVPPPQPPQPAPPKVTASVQIKYPEMPSQAQAALWTGIGVPDSPELQAEIQLQEKMKGLVQADQAGTAADNLLAKSPNDQQSEQNAQELQDSQADKQNTQVNASADRNLKMQELKIKDKVANKPVNGRA